MKKHGQLSLVKRNPDDDEPLTAAVLRERLQTHAAAVGTWADQWASREDPVSFKEVEKAIRDRVRVRADRDHVVSRAARRPRDARVPIAGRARWPPSGGEI